MDLQTKLKGNELGDLYEQEADRIANQVMAAPAHHAHSSAPPRIRRVSEQSHGHEDATPASVNQALASASRPLEPTLRQDMEQRFGHDFSKVRVHSGAPVEESAQDVNAHAYTVGHNIVFGAGQYAPRTAAGRRLLAHELTHVVQQTGMDTAHVGGNDHQRGQSIVPHLQPPLVRSGIALQRKPVERPDIKPVPALAPLEVVAQEAAKLVLKNYAADKISAGPVLSAVLDERTGKIYIGLNSGIPPEVADVVAKAIAVQKERVVKGEVIVVRTDPLAQGGHSETNAVNEAVRAREALLKQKVTEKDLATFVLHNVWLKGADRKFTAAARCEHCARITRSVSVTPAVFFAEGGVSGTIRKPPTGGYRAPRVGPGGATGAVSGTIDNRRTSPSPAPPTTVPPAETGGSAPRTAPPVTSPRGPIPPTSAAPAAHAAADLLTVVLARFIFPDAEENYKRRIQELQNKVWPEIEARIDAFLDVETARIAEVGGRSSDLFVTVKLALWTQSSDVQGSPAIPVNLVVEEVKLNTRNINGTEASHSVTDAARCRASGHCRSNEMYSFPVSSAIRQEATRRLRGVGTSDLKRFNQLADTLKASSSKVRMAGLLNIYKLTKDNGPLRGPAVQQIMGMLRDPEANIRGIAALVLQSLGATEAIPSIRRAVAETTDRNVKNAIQKSLDQLEGFQKGGK